MTIFEKEAILNKEMLDKSEVAKLLHCSIRTIDEERAKRGMPYLLMPGCRKVLFDRTQVLTWLESYNNIDNNNVNSNNDNDSKVYGKEAGKD